MRLTLLLINGISRVLQKLLKYFNGTIVSTYFVPLFSVLSPIFCLNLNELLLLGKSSAGLSLYYWNILPDFFE